MSSPLHPWRSLQDEDSSLIPPRSRSALQTPSLVWCWNDSSGFFGTFGRLRHDDTHYDGGRRLRSPAPRRCARLPLPAVRNPPTLRFLLGRWTSGRAVDLPDRTHVIGEVDDAARHPARFHIAHVARFAQHLGPMGRLETEILTECSPL